MSDPISRELFARAQKRIPGGVNSPVRAFRSVGGEPVFVRSAHGCEIEGADGTRYIDYVGSWGPMILGHAHPAVVNAITEAAHGGTSFGAPTEREVVLAEMLCDAVPSMDMVRLTSSGTEACMAALRLARGFTGRDVIVKFEGCYHGHADFLLVKAGSGLATLGVPDSAGVPASVAATTFTLPFNGIDAVREAFASHGSKIAAVIVEPVVGNMGCVPPAPGFHETLRDECTRHGAMLVFDEVMTGFRVAFGGAQQKYGIRPDLTTLAKVAGGGVPLGAFGGRRDVMSQLAPLGPVYQAGTLSGNPVATAAAIAMLTELRHGDVYGRLEAIGAALEAGIADAARRAGVTVVFQRVGAMWTVFFTHAPVRNWSDADRCDRAKFGRWHAAMLSRGIYLPPSQFEAAFHSTAHDDRSVERTIAAAFDAFKSL